MKIEKYELHLDVNDSEYSYNGREKIFLEVEGETLVLNSVGLEIRRILVNGGESLFHVKEAAEELLIEGPLRGKTSVEIDFSAKISRSLSGFYLAKGPEAEMLTTQFESSSARRAFPCLDHPAYKARFSLSLTIREDLDAISNMPIKSRQSGLEKKTITFEETPRMSTYLLYFGIGRFDERVEKVNGKQVILAAPKGLLTSSQFPMDISKESLRYYEDYFAFPYMLPKLHLISVPQFAAGAMENWGAITMREIYMDIGPSTSGRYRKLTAEVIAHEVVHQWFGDLVTMKWWNDLWLNESFATFMAYKVVDHRFPEWDSWGDFVIFRTAAAMSGDALDHSHPIDAEVKNPNEVAQIFDDISYGKGGSVLRMLESYVGEAAFRNGIRAYLRKHAYDNAVGGDLWNAIEKSSGQPVTNIMQSWVKTPGYPLITAQEKEGKIVLQQERFFLGDGKSGQIWLVPLTVRRKGTAESVLMEAPNLEVGRSGFIKLNADETGFYRVRYDERLWGNILSNRDQLTHLDIWGLINDLCAFLISGRMNLTDYLQRIEPFEGTTDRLVVEEIAGQYSRLCLLLPENKAVTERARRFFRNHLERIGEKKQGESQNISILRGMLSRERSVVDPEFAMHLSDLCKNFNKADSDLRAAVALSEALAHNDFSALQRLLAGSKSDEDKAKLIAAMGWLQGDENLGRALELIKREKIKKQDTFIFYGAAAANPRGREFIFKHLNFVVSQLRIDFVDTGTPSRILEQIIPLIGIGREKEMVDRLETLRSPDIETGIEKGKEFLGIYSNFTARESSQPEVS